MVKQSRIFCLQLLLILFTSLSAADTNSVTGSWEWRGPSESGLWLKTIQNDNTVHFQLELSRGAPSYNSGFIEGSFELRNKTALFKSTEHPSCEITFFFSENKVILQERDGLDSFQCGFGYNVHAIGTLLLKSRALPVFSRGDPRFGD